jgi:putative flavoprotein involved in K+ transport
MHGQRDPERIHTVVIGGGQSGLSVGYHLARRGLPFVILDANSRVGDAWRHRWDSLRLFTPARFNGLDGWPFPAAPDAFPTKDEMADYLEAYAARFELPVRLGTAVAALTEEDGRFVAHTGGSRIEADTVVVGTGVFAKPYVPELAGELSPSITQLHSSA